MVAVSRVVGRIAICIASALAGGCVEDYVHVESSPPTSPEIVRGPTLHWSPSDAEVVLQETGGRLSVEAKWWGVCARAERSSIQRTEIRKRETTPTGLVISAALFGAGMLIYALPDISANDSELAGSVFVVSGGLHYGIDKAREGEERTELTPLTKERSLTPEACEIGPAKNVIVTIVGADGTLEARTDGQGRILFETSVGEPSEVKLHGQPVKWRTR